MIERVPIDNHLQLLSDKDGKIGALIFFLNLSDKRNGIPCEIVSRLNA
jgi:hypothetical protein